MKVTIDWLQEYADFDLPDAKINDMLTLSGTEVETTEHINGKTVFGLEVTSNRTDCLSMIGIAREMATLLEQEVKIPQPKPDLAMYAQQDRIEIALENKELCSYYTGHYIRNVKNCETPAWMKDRLEAIGLRSINAVVDISNYVLFEFGQPMHTFDRNKITGRKITVRNATENEKFTAIDQKERKLRKEDLVIADERGVLALAGVMGGLDTEVSMDTTDIFLESAWFEPVNVKAVSVHHGLFSDSSFRFERNINPENVLKAARRCAELIVEICGGEISSTVEVAGEKEPHSAEITLELGKVERVLGLKIENERIFTILNHLGLKVTSREKNLDNDLIHISVPSHRPDCNRDVDLIEEIARIVGLDDIPEVSKLPLIPVRKTKEQKIIERVYNSFLAYGYNEVMTDSFVKEDATWAATPWENSGTFVAGHPVRKGEAQLRTTLLLSIAKVFSGNVNSHGAVGRFFENAHIYLKKENGQPNEKKVMAAIDSNYENLKSCLDFILGGTLAKGWEILPIKNELFAEGGGAEFKFADKTIAVFGMLNQKSVKSAGVKEKLYGCEIDMTAFIETQEQKVVFQPFSRFPASNKELSVLATDTIVWRDIEKTVTANGGEFLREVRFLDEYRGKNLGEGNRSIHFEMIFQSEETTLSTEIVHEAFNKVIASLEKDLGLSLRE